MTKAKTRTPRLGRGLSALMAQPVQLEPAEQDAADTTEAADGTRSADEHAGSISDNTRTGVTMLPLAAIAPNPHQPRQNFDPGALQTLAESIRNDGVLQPVLVRRVRHADNVAGGLRYELAAGERRLRAAEIAGLDHIPVIVRDLDDQQLAEVALVENLQRQDLNPIERAMGFQHLVDRFALSHDSIANRVGVDRSTISNSLRLLHLCDSVRRLVQDGILSGGHAKALVAMADARRQELLAKQAVQHGWSVRQLEAAVRRAAAETDDQATPAPRRAPHLTDLEQQIGQQLGTKVRVRSGRKKGTGALTIRFYSLDQFDELMARLGVETA